MSAASSVTGVSGWQTGHAGWQPEATEASWLATLRRQALAAFDTTGLPTTKVEAWHYTPLRAVRDVAWTHAGGVEVGAGLTAFVDAARLPGASAELVFVDGHHVADLSRTDGLPPGAVVSLSQALAADGEAVRARLATLAPWHDAPLNALNTAFVQDGVRVHVPRRVDVPGPVHILVVGWGRDVPTVAHLRNLVVADTGSRVTVVVSFVGRPGHSVLHNVVDEVGVGADAQVTQVVLGDSPDDHLVVHRTDARLDRDARYTHQAFWLGGGLVRGEVHATHAGPGAEATLDGVFVAGSTQHVDCHTVIDHAVPRCTTREVYKGVLGGKARGVFDGTVIVRADAQQTDASQDSRNLLLSDDADANAKPTLEIYADDVKCAHGTTVGRLDPDQLAYLRMRGLPLSLARRVLIGAFVSDRVDRIAHEGLRARVAGRVEAALAALQEEA
ncbi:MAG: Fe-S cluster assembly protein SufD [Alphaproteobacteria bacterium]|nr:Fe-S cluster assembly protein SufD [Alphaproteobacteria bacterium]